MLGRNNRRQEPSVNAGSMADIAFLLLIFFLVTTQILEDKGIRVKLPQWDPNRITENVNQNNVLTILVNDQNKVLLEKQAVEVESIKEKTKRFIMNPQGLKNLPSNPRSAIVSLKNDRGTSYKTYLEVYNEIKSAYNELWEEASQKRFRRSYAELNEMDRIDIRKDIPLVISEAEPTDVRNIQ